MRLAHSNQGKKENRYWDKKWARVRTYVLVCQTCIDCLACVSIVHLATGLSNLLDHARFIFIDVNARTPFTLRDGCLDHRLSVCPSGSKWRIEGDTVSLSVITLCNRCTSGSKKATHPT